MARLICDADRDSFKSAEMLLFQQDIMVYDIEDVFKLITKYWSPDDIVLNDKLNHEVAGQATRVILQSMGLNHTNWQTMSDEQKIELENQMAVVHDAVLNAITLLHTDIVMNLPSCVEPDDAHSYDKRTMTYVVDFVE